MNKIEVMLLQYCDAADKMAPFLARMTQRGHELENMQDVIDLYNKEASDKFKKTLSSMQHGTIKRFSSFTVAIYGESRRFLAQIRTHQHVDFVSGSLQYSDYRDTSIQDLFVVPYEFMYDPDVAMRYLDSCEDAFNNYLCLADQGHDAAAYVLPNGIRNVLVMHANVQEWQYLIKLRTCRRNSAETRYVMYKIWDALYKSISGKELFSPEIIGADCQMCGCKEGHMCCGNPLPKNLTPQQLIALEFPNLVWEAE